MSARELVALAPTAIVALTALVALAAIAVQRSAAATTGIAAAGLVLALAALPAAARTELAWVGPLVAVDGHARFFVGLVLACTLAVLVLAHDYFEEGGERREELVVLLLVAAFGAAVLASARHLASLFLGLETLTISLYGLIAYPRQEPDVRAVEAGIKYLVLAGVGSATLLFGIALVYAATGSLALGDVAVAPGLLGGAGLALVLGALAFKLALVPLHMWTPDVYEGSPAPVAGFVASVSKGAVFAVLLRLVFDLPAEDRAPVREVLAALAAVSMVAGNLLALLQSRLERLLAYSSIAHLGYALVAVVAGGEAGAEAGSYYVAAYAATVLLAFGALGPLSGDRRALESVEGLRGLAWSRPGLALTLGVALLSLAGLPITAGFLAKVWVLAAGLAEGRWGLAMWLAAGSALGVFAYLRVLLALVARTPEPAIAGRVRPATALVLAALVAVVVIFGVGPGPLAPWLARAASDAAASPPHAAVDGHPPRR